MRFSKEGLSKSYARTGYDLISLTLYLFRYEADNFPFIFVGRLKAGGRLCNVLSCGPGGNLGESSD